MKKFLQWAGGIFEDSSRKASKKAIIAYWLMSLVTYMVVKHGDKTEGVNMEMFWGLLGGVLLLMGYALTEWFSKKSLSYGKDGPDK